MFTRDHVFTAEVKNWNLWPRRCSLEADTPSVLDSCHLLWFEAFASVKCIIYTWFRCSEPCRCLIQNQGSWGCWRVFAAHGPTLPSFLLPVSSYLSIFLKLLLLKCLVKTNKNPLLFSFDFNKYVIVMFIIVCDPLIPMLLKYPMQFPSSSSTVLCPEFSACFLKFLYSVLCPPLVGIKMSICPLHVKNMNFLKPKGISIYFASSLFFS